MNNQSRIGLAALLTAALFTCAPSLLFAQDAPQSSQTPFYKVSVIEATPLPGLDLTLDEIPAPVQTATAADIQASGALDLSDFLNRRFHDVYVNEMQGNEFQPDINYRGYTASPLLGTPQGLSVYMDGVRLNQPFGDVVSWDLIPRIAISSIALMPGSNPLFGLNTLGGALTIQTKNGLTSPGTTVQGIYGSHARRSLELEHGGSSKGGWNWYVAGNFFADDGWREQSPSRVDQMLGTFGRSGSRGELSLTAAYADTSLTGNGLQDQRFLNQDYASVYTIPDQTANRSTFLNLAARRDLSPSLNASGNIYYRNIRANTYNADINDDSLDESLYQLSAADVTALTRAGYSGFPTTGANAANTPFPSWRCIAQALELDEPDEKCNGLLTHTHAGQQNDGVSGQLTWDRRPARGRNQFTVGGAFDGSRVDYQQSSQFGYLNPDLTVTPVNAFADGSTNVDGQPFDTRVDLLGRPSTWSAYATDTWSPTSRWHATVSARYNRTTVDNLDQLLASGPGSLTGRYVFERLNPSVGVTFVPSSTFQAYANYGEGSRAPTSIELGCADPTQPCKLPNALAGDPPLNQVVTRTIEAGVRGSRGKTLSWSISAFRAQNDEDILFLASEQTGFGYFKNFGQTRRQGVDVSVDARVSRFTLGAGYTFLDATYQSAETFDGSSNSTNDSALAGMKGIDGTIEVVPGDRIPLIPRNMLKGYADWDVTRRMSLDVDLVALGGSYARGNENNLDEPDGVYYLGSGSIPGYAVVNLGAHYDVVKGVQLVAEVNNIFDTHYYTAAQLESTGLAANQTFVARPFPAVNGNFPLLQATFLAPGAPTTFWVGTRVKF